MATTTHQTPVDHSEPPSGLPTPEHQRQNACYAPYRAYEHGYTDARFFSATRRPGATRGRDLNYELGFAYGLLDAIDCDHRQLQ